MLMKALLICAAIIAIFAHPAPDTKLSVPKDDVTFQLFTRSNPDTYIPLVIGELGDMPQGSIDVYKPFKFIIHGYTDSASITWVINMRKAYLENQDCNVVVVDWSVPAMSLYNLSAAYTKGVAEFVAQLIIELHTQFGLNWDNVHLIGHSLGAHVAGFTGQNIIKTQDQEILRITGLDPAGPLFLTDDETERVSAGDATLVDIIHTDGNKLGYYGVTGDVDFYVNGGTAFQPGCWTREMRGEAGPILNCSHCRSYAYFIESISSSGFIAKQCGSYKDYKNGKCDTNPSAVMGEHLDPATKGVFYLQTNNKSPFAKN